MKNRQVSFKVFIKSYLPNSGTLFFERCPNYLYSRGLAKRIRSTVFISYMYATYFIMTHPVKQNTSISLQFLGGLILEGWRFRYIPWRRPPVWVNYCLTRLALSTFSRVQSILFINYLYSFSYLLLVINGLN